MCPFGDDLAPIPASVPIESIMAQSSFKHPAILYLYTNIINSCLTFERVQTF